MGRLPKKALDRWTKLKHELLSTIDKIKDDMVDDDHKKAMKKKVKALYDQFNSGLSKTLKKADAAKTDKDALKPLSQSIKTTNAYLGKVKKAQNEWGVDGKSLGEKFEEALKDIKRACVGETVRIAKSTG